MVVVRMFKISVVVFFAALICYNILGFSFLIPEKIHSNLAIAQFIATGAISSACAAALTVARKRGFFIVSIVSFFVLILITKPRSLSLFAMDLGLAIIPVISAWFGWYLSSKLSFGVLKCTLAWGVAFALVHMMSFVFIASANGLQVSSTGVTAALEIGAILGLGIGLGVSVSQRLIVNLAGMLDVQGDV